MCFILNFATVYGHGPQIIWLVEERCAITLISNLAFKLIMFAWWIGFIKIGFKKLDIIWTESCLENRILHCIYFFYFYCDLSHTLSQVEHLMLTCGLIAFAHTCLVLSICYGPQLTITQQSMQPRVHFSLFEQIIQEFGIFWTPVVKCALTYL